MDWMATPDGVSRCRLAPLSDLVFTTPTGKGVEKQLRCRLHDKRLRE